MNDEHEPDPQLEEQPDPAEEARIRALLAELADEPDVASMPPEVAARLDETLAGLVAEREDLAPESSPTNVVPLRRRWARRSAAAAAAIIVAGAGGVAAANFGLLGDRSSGDSATAGSASKAETLDESTGSPSAPGTAPEPANGLVDAPTIRAESFEADVARLLQQDSTLVDTSTGHERRGANRRESAEKGTTADSQGACPGPRTPRGAARTTVRYDGTLAVLLVRPARAGAPDERIAEVWTCPGDRRLARTSVPVPRLASPSPSP